MEASNSQMSQVSWFAIWVFFNVGPAWYTIYTNKKVKPAADLDPKFRPFARFDYENWSYVTVFFTHFFFFPRYIVGWFLWLLFWAITNTVCLFHKEGEPYKDWQLKII